MNMSSEGKILWRQDFSHVGVFQDHNIIKIDIPKDVLTKKQISREINFSSKSVIKNLRLIQQIKLLGNISKYL
jgi:hypothetical protein